MAGPTSDVLGQGRVDRVSLETRESMSEAYSRIQSGRSPSYLDLSDLGRCGPLHGDMVGSTVVVVRYGHKRALAFDVSRRPPPLGRWNCEARPLNTSRRSGVGEGSDSCGRGSR